MRTSLLVGVGSVAGIAIAAAALTRISPRELGRDAHDHAETEAEPATGPHGGRLLEAGDTSIEVTIYENGLPPEMRLYASRAGEPLDPTRVSASVELARLGGRRDVLEFAPEQDYLRSDAVVSEPHSFDVLVRARVDGVAHSFSYAAHEGRTEISARAAAASGIAAEPAGPATIVETVEVTGTVQADPGRVSRVRPRFGGIVTEVHRTVGDRVESGAALATIETNESLKSVPVTAPIAGVIVTRDIQAGQVAGTDPLFVIADLSEVWVQLDVFGDQTARVRAGQDAELRTLEGLTRGGRIDYISPLVAHASQSVRARIIVPNPDYRLRPGQFVRAEVVTATVDVPLAVRRSALQTFRDSDVVFVKVGDVYEVRMLELGRSDDVHVEVLAGLAAGDLYVTENSYLIKADIEKAGASHDH